MQVRTLTCNGSWMPSSTRRRCEIKCFPALAWHTLYGEAVQCLSFRGADTDCAAMRWYAMSGTGLGYGATSLLCAVRY
eukprot:3941002-Rhodomonas_salina.3